MSRVFKGGEIPEKPTFEDSAAAMAVISVPMNAKAALIRTAPLR